ncbi:MAG: C25 family cysteine peptidase, partial [bacterium]
ENYTEFSIIMNGFYIEDILGHDGKVYQRVEVPDYATTNDVGLPELPSIRGLLGITDNTENVYMNVLESTEMTVLGEYNIWPHQRPVICGETPEFEKDEEFYNSDEWFPFEHKEVGDPGIFKYYTVENVGYIPFRYNPYLRQLKVNPYLRLRVDYTGGGSIPIATMDEDMANLMRGVIWNFDYLNPNIDNYAPVYYLIITPDEYYNEVSKFAEWLRTIYPYNIDVVKLYDNNNPGDIKKIIDYYYETHHSTDYVILMGNIFLINTWTLKWNWNSIPSGYEYFPSDYYYTLLKNRTQQEGDIDLYPEFAIGRIPFSNSDELDFQLKKQIYYNSQPFNNNVLLVSHKKFERDSMEWNIASDNISGYQYYHFPKPIFHSCYGKFGATNNNVKEKINNGVSSVCYLGHGLPDSWMEWNLNDEYWTRDEIYSLDNINKLTIVFNYCCLNGRLDYYNGNFLCKDWMLGNIENNRYIGSVATFGHSNFSVYQAWENRLNFMDVVYKCIYGSENNNPGAKKGLGWVLNTATISDLERYNFDTGFVNNAYAKILTGDPAIRMRTGVNNLETNSLNIIEHKEINKLSKIEVEISNPVYDNLKLFIKSDKEYNVNIDIYDISGRRINKVYCGKLNEGENKIEIDNINLKTGLYILNIYSDCFNEYRKVVVIR